jgi:hypothetical protein
MEALDWPDIEIDEQDESCLTRHDCITELLAMARAGCIYCRLSEMEDIGD